MTAMWLASLCTFILIFARINVGDNSYSSDNYFIFPSPPGPSDNFAADLALTLGSTQNISWSTTISSYYIVLFQQNIDPPSGLQLQTIYSVDEGGAGQQSFSWQVQTYNANQSLSPVYFLWVLPGDPLGFTSHYFNITQKAQTSSSSTSSATPTSLTSLTTSTIATPLLATPPQRSSQTASAAPSSASSSTETIRVGLGVGLGIGIPLVLIAGIWIGLKAVKQKKSALHDTGSEVLLSQLPKLESSRDSYVSSKPSNITANQIHEAPGADDQCHEAPMDRALIELG